MSYEKEIDHFVTESDEVVGLKDARARGAVSILNESFRLVNTLDLESDESGDSFRVSFTESDDGVPYYEQELVIEIMSNTMPWQYLGISVDVENPDGTITSTQAGECRGGGVPKLIHIQKLGSRWVTQYGVFSGTYGSATLSMFATFHANTVESDAPAIRGVSVGPFKQVTAKIYAKRKMEEL